MKKRFDGRYYHAIFNEASEMWHVIDGTTNLPVASVLPEGESIKFKDDITFTATDLQDIKELMRPIENQYNRLNP